MDRPTRPARRFDHPAKTCIGVDEPCRCPDPEMELKRAWLHHEQVSGLRGDTTPDKPGRTKRGFEMVGLCATKAIACWDTFLCKHMSGKADAIQPEARTAPVQPERHADQ